MVERRKNLLDGSCEVKQTVNTLTVIIKLVNANVNIDDRCVDQHDDFLTKI